MTRIKFAEDWDKLRVSFLRRDPKYREIRGWALERSFVVRSFVQRKWGVDALFVRTLERELQGAGVISRGTSARIRIGRDGRLGGAFHIDREAAARYARVLSATRHRLAELHARRKRSWVDYYWAHRSVRLGTQYRWGRRNAGARALLQRMRRRWESGGRMGTPPRIADARAALAAGAEPYVDIARVDWPEAVHPNQAAISGGA